MASHTLLNKTGSFGYLMMLLCASLTLLSLSSGGGGAAAAANDDDVPTKAHFMFEFIPSFPDDNSRKACESSEIEIIQKFIFNVIQEDTGFSRDHSHKEKFLDSHYNEGLHPGFDVTFECPKSCEGFPTDWCELVCEPGDRTHLGHAPLDKVANDLKARIHESTKSHNEMFAVKCLGNVGEVDLHMAVATSPVRIPKKKGYIDLRPKNPETASEL